MTSLIGIKLANGEFYSIMEENSLAKKRLILTTVHDRQHSVQIDLFRSAAQSMIDAQYIGSLVIENIKSRPKGEPSIEMVISSNENGEITADAVDLDTGAAAQHHILSVSLKTLDETGKDIELPDFELESNEEPPQGLYNKALEINKKESKPLPWLIIIIIALIVLLAFGGIWLFFLGGTEKLFPNADKTEPQTSVTQPVEQAPQRELQPPPAPVEIPAYVPPPVIVAPATPPPAAAEAPRRERPPAPVSTYRVPATIPPGGVPYTIRWGDTLWDISEAFYRTPWQYPRIARFNNIQNPDYIIAGRTIRVPPRN